MKTFDKEFWKWLTPVLIVILIICSFPYLFTLRTFTGISFDDTGSIGDTIGGIMGPFIAIVAAILTFIAFWVQYKANEQLRTDIKIERFESKFYELVRIHINHVNEIEISDTIKGRAVFVEMFEELRFTYYSLKKLIEDFLQVTSIVDIGFDPNDEETLLKISYIIFFLGVGQNSEGSIYKFMSDFCNKDFCDTFLSDFKSTKGNLREILNKSAQYSIKFSNGTDFVIKPKYLYFEGHISKLGHYYRNLYQTVKFVDEMNDELIPYKQKYDHVKTLRAQLSSHEQLLFYYNALSPFGNAWIKNGYLVKYRMIKNIPLQLADFGIKPQEKFKKEIEDCKKNGEEFFEWRE